MTGWPASVRSTAALCRGHDGKWEPSVGVITLVSLDEGWYSLSSQARIRLTLSKTLSRCRPGSKQPSARKNTLATARLHTPQTLPIAQRALQRHNPGCLASRTWWNGRHTGLKILRGQPRAGSSPAVRTRLITRNEMRFAHQPVSPSSASQVYTAIGRLQPRSQPTKSDPTIAATSPFCGAVTARPARP